VDHPARLKLAGTSDSYISGRASTAALISRKVVALLDERRTGRAVYRSIDAATAGELRVGRVNDYVDRLLDDVSHHELNLAVLRLKTVCHLL
jgi:hypothetical protein